LLSRFYNLPARVQPVEAKGQHGNTISRFPRTIEAG